MKIKKWYVYCLEEFVEASRERRQMIEAGTPTGEIHQIKISDADGDCYLPTRSQLEAWKAEQQERLRSLYKI